MPKIGKSTIDFTEELMRDGRPRTIKDIMSAFNVSRYPARYSLSALEDVGKIEHVRGKKGHHGNEKIWKWRKDWEDCV